MPGIDPALLAHLPSQAYPGSPPSPVTAAGPDAMAKEPPAAEPVQLHDCCQEAEAAVDAAREAIEKLQQDAELAANIDPKAEKMIGDAADMIAKIDDSMEQIMTILAGQRADHEEMVSGEGGDGGGGSRGGPPPPG